MLDTWRWREEYVYSAWIYSGQYFTVLSYERDFGDVMDALREHTRAQGLTENAPMICLSSFRFADEHATRLREDHEGLITLIVE